MVAPFSLERLTGYSRLEVIDRSVIGASMTPSRDFGLMVFNTQPWRGWITYGAAIINGTGQNRADDNDAKDLVGRVATKVPRLPHLTVGVNAQTGEQAQGDRRRVGIDFNYERAPTGSPSSGWHSDATTPRGSTPRASRSSAPTGTTRGR